MDFFLLLKHIKYLLEKIFNLWHNVGKFEISDNYLKEGIQNLLKLRFLYV